MVYNRAMGEHMPNTPNIKCAFTEIVEISTLRPHPKNRNKHPKKQIEAMAEIIRSQGWRRPVTVSNRSGNVTAGHGRLEVARLLHSRHPNDGWNYIPVDRQNYDSAEQEYADVQADNAIALWAELDIPEIQLDIKEFPTLDLKLLGIEGLEKVDIHTRFDPGTADDQGKLDAGKTVECPHCKEHFDVSKAKVVD